MNQVHLNRLEKLRIAINQKGLGGAVLSRPQHLFYFLGYEGGFSPAFLLVTEKDVLAVSPQQVMGVETLTYVDYDIQKLWDVQQNIVKALDIAIDHLHLDGKHIGVEDDHLVGVWRCEVNRRVADCYPLRDMLWELRQIKDTVEIDQITENICGNDRVFVSLEKYLQPGIVELDVWAYIYSEMCKTAGGPINLEADLGVGVRGSNPDAKPGNNSLTIGDTVFVDIYSATHMYYADTTRTFTIGRPDKKQSEIHSILLAAIERGEKLLQAGIPANQVDAAVRDVIRQAGYEENFPHHSGHAFGLFQQEKPYLIPAETMPLAAGMIVTLEPGIYLPEWGGMRMESNYLIEENGARRLDKYSRELITCE